MASDGIYSVTLDEAIEAMRLTAADMSVKYKETSLSVRDTPTGAWSAYQKYIWFSHYRVSRYAIDSIGLIDLTY